MTARDLLRTQIDDGTYQLRKVFDITDESAVDQKPLPTMMSLREMVVHVAEAYEAVLAEARGEKHSWGTFTLPHENYPELLEKFFALRDQAVAAVLSHDEAEAAKVGTAYLVAHDYYHVGQAAAIRIAVTPDWDPYSIYQF